MIEGQPGQTATSRASRGARLRNHLRVTIPTTLRARPETTAAPFVLHLRRVDGDRLHVVASGPAGQAEATSDLPPVEAVPREVAEGDTRPWKIACRTGERLFAAVFPPAIAHLLEASREQANSTPLPIVLVPESDDLAGLPWELLRDGERERFLALSPRTPLSRAPDGPAATAHGTVERGNLRVTLLAESVEEEALALMDAIGADARVDLGVADRLAADAHPHVLLIADQAMAKAAVPPDAPLVVVSRHGVSVPPRPSRARAELVVPSSMRPEARITFASNLAEALADGQALDTAVAAARRAVADNHSVVSLDWAEPVLVAASPSTPLVAPARSAAVAAGAEVAAKTVGWFRDALAGSVSAVVFLLAGLLVYRLGFSTSNAIELDLLSPYELFSTFKGMILALSTYEDRILLFVVAASLALTAVVAVLWLRNRRVEPEEQPGLAARLASPLTGVRALSFLVMATLTIAGAYAYQQYLWHVVLPIPSDALGLAITREAVAASPRQELADVLYAQGQTGRIVVRDLPVAFDAGDTKKARALGRRIGAKAVLIYREIDRGESGKQYAAYVVFTDPSAGLTIGGAPATGSSADVVQVREGVEIPALRTDTVAELVAAAAGVLAYNENQLREAIALFDQATPADPSAPNTGLVNFYLADALRLDGQDEAAIAALERAATYYETRQAAAVPLLPQDELLLAKTYYTRGWIAGSLRAEGFDDAIVWYGKALPLRDDLLSRSDQLDRPAVVRALYAQLYTHLAEAHRRLGDDAEQASWEEQADAELDALAREAPPNDSSFLAQEAAARLYIGDCPGAVAALEKIRTIEPDSIDAANGIAIVTMFQDRFDLAAASLQQVLSQRPDDAIARIILANLTGFRYFAEGRYFEPVYLDRQEALLREILADDPASEDAHREIADSAEIRAQATLADSTAYLQGDDLTYRKSDTLWPRDPARREAALAAWEIVIQERRILATEIHPDDPSAVVAVAETYDNRQSVHYNVIEVWLNGSDPSMAAPESDADQVVADAQEIRDWTNRVLAPDSGASRLDRLRAWRAIFDSLQREWLVAALRGDDARVEAIMEERRRLLAEALPVVEEAPLTTADEALPVMAIYIEAYLMAGVDEDADRAATYLAKVSEVQSWQLSHLAAEVRFDSTICREQRERAAGDDARASGNLDTARTRYETALAANPDDVGALTGLAAVLVAQGDLDGATARATQATTVMPDAAPGWVALAQARLAAGDETGAGTALGLFLDLTSSLPPQERMADVRDAIAAVAAVLETRPDQTALIRSTVPTFSGALDAMPVDFARTYQYPQLYAQLGALALDAGDTVNAETLLRRSLDLDPHQAAARADLAIAVLVQDRDATAEIDGATAETRDPLWQQFDPEHPALFPRQLLGIMSDRIDDYRRRFLDQSVSVQPLAQAIAAETQRLNSGDGPR